MAIKFKIGDSTTAPVEEPKPVPQVKAKLNIRKSVDGNLIIYDYPDVYIVVMPAKRKIVAIPTENIDENLYLIQNRFFQNLVKKGIIDPSTIRAGNIYGALEATIPQEEDGSDVNAIDLAILTISRWIDEERPAFEYRHSIEDEYDKWVTDPPDEETTEHGKVPARDSKQYNRTVNSYTNQQMIYEEKEADPSDRLALFFKIGVPGGDKNWVQFFLYDTVSLQKILDDTTAATSRGLRVANHVDEVVEQFGVATVGIRIRPKKKLRDYPCYDVKYEVGMSAVHLKYQGQKYGRMIYGLMMTQIYPEYVMADRGSVSTSARRTWESFDKNPKIEKVPPDKPPFIGQFDNVGANDYPKTDVKQDDCDAPGDVRSGAYRRETGSLMKGYRYTSGKSKAMLKRLMKNHEKFVQKNSKIKIDWLRSAQELFDMEY